VPSNEGTLFNGVVSTKLVLSDDEFYLCNRAELLKKEFRKQKLKLLDTRCQRQYCYYVLKVGKTRGK